MEPTPKAEHKKEPEATSTTQPTAETAPAAPSQPVGHAAQPQPAPQYVITHRSLEGVSGWLAVWVVLFALGSIAFIYSFFAQISGEGGVETRVVDLIFAPILAVMYIVAILLIVMRKTLGKWVAIAALITGGLYSMINILIAPQPGQAVALTISSIIVLWLITGLFSLYFMKSERVRQTLTK